MPPTTNQLPLFESEDRDAQEAKQVPVAKGCLGGRTNERIRAALRSLAGDELARVQQSGNSREGALSKALPKGQNDAPPVVPVEKEHADWQDFFLTYGRFPHICDKKKPWEYFGWNLAYRILAESFSSPELTEKAKQQGAEIVAPLRIPPVWTYWFETMDRGHLLDRPIPRVDYTADLGSAGFKTIEKWIGIIENRSGSSAFELLLDWFLWGFGHRGATPPHLDEKTNEQLYRAVNLGVLLEAPGDYLGEWLAANSRYNACGFFPTPHHICEILVRINPPKLTDTINDPCVGSGRMLLHAGNHSLRLYGMDINHTILKICYINGYLYCPWLVRAFPESFFEKGEINAATASNRSRPVGRTAPRPDSNRRARKTA